MKYSKNTQPQPQKPRTLSRTALLLAFALITYAIESAVPPLVPGMMGARLGLANVFILYALFTMGAGPAIAIMLLKGILAPILVGSPTGIFYSLAGGALALAAMIFVKKRWSFGIAGISVTGAFFHNLGQLIAASLLLGSGSVFYAFPQMAALSVPIGIFTGLLCAGLIKALNQNSQF